MSERLVVVTGLSGAGKTTALGALSDVGFYVVDNLPPRLASETVRVCREGGIERVALGIDVRVGAFLDGARAAIEALRGDPGGLTVLYLDAADEVLVRRFSETRRPHPLLHSKREEHEDADDAGVLDGIRLERERLAPIRNMATLVVDTSYLSMHELRRQVLERFGHEGVAPHMQLRILSFGYKHGMPLDADLVFDVRFLDNPYFVHALRDFDGTAVEVRDFVMSSVDALALLEHLDGLLDFLVPRYEREGKSYLTVAIGCTGGRHRSVVIASELGKRLERQRGRRVAIVHRDLARGAMITSMPVARGGRAGSDREGEGH
jgi:UPF0042 nucleotide-binding protein